MSRLRRAVAIAVMLAAIAPAALAVCRSSDAGSACPFAEDDCCVALRMTCCGADPAPQPVAPPPAPDGLRPPVFEAVSLPAAALVAVAPPGAVRVRPEISPPRDADDLTVFLHILLI